MLLFLKKDDVCSCILHSILWFFPLSSVVSSFYAVHSYYNATSPNIPMSSKKACEVHWHDWELSSQSGYFLHSGRPKILSIFTIARLWEQLLPGVVPGAIPGIVRVRVYRSHQKFGVLDTCSHMIHARELSTIFLMAGKVKKHGINRTSHYYRVFVILYRYFTYSFKVYLNFNYDL